MNCFCTLNFEAYVAEPAFFSGHLGSRVKLWTLVCFEVTTAPRLRSSPTTSTLIPALGEQKLQCLRVVGEVLQVSVL